jgi:hypothetical protein
VKSNAAVATAPSESSSSVVPYVLIGGGVALGAVGAVTGVMALGKSKDWKAATYATGGSTASIADTRSSAKTLALVSDISLVAAVACAGTGITLLLTGKSSDPPSKQATNVRVFFTPTGVALAGGFQ